MFHYIDDKIKKLAYFYAVTGIIISIITGILYVINGEWFVFGVMIAVIGSFFSYSIALLIYGFGQLIENTGKTTNRSSANHLSATILKNSDDAGSSSETNGYKQTENTIRFKQCTKCGETQPAGNSVCTSCGNKL